MDHNNKPTLYWSLLEKDNWKLYIAATSKGICYIGPINESFDELSKWSKKHFPESLLNEDNIKLEEYKVEIVEYLEGNRKNFTFPTDLKGTEFQKKVWNALCEIPYGETKSYSDVANAINKPTAVRAVGSAIGANPILMSVPCHRVIGKNGSLTGFRGGLEMKTRLLDLERQR
ncbi:methylated-DNA--[protein]-cysteine S-methyltransferase [Lederbergia panacisoli]|uniref:methylated-DNA--[protein]-cysteine S-methyltransferase n=1 Tax=Lederbergia panacisoli TaxID=1255251 RepID=UPI00214CF9AA|nr:methylated-DNA--[protein]-cysteine S-methyltransferase [Lederbergia panacisoli]MCR2822865.1 methylated-DNA--[protein]-cysteine S-methyltransferase [Lederbergia panacisoli]